MDNGPSKLVAGALNLCLVLPAVVMLYAVIAAPVASAEADCEVPASNPPDIDQYFEETSVDSGGFWGWGDDMDSLRSLDRDFSTDMTVYNDSANAIGMEPVSYTHLTLPTKA